MYHLTVEKSFAAAHQLHAHKGKCKHLHGHTFKVRVTLSSDTLDSEQGFLVDFGDVKSELNSLLDEFDHKNLNDLSYFQGIPATSESIARVIYKALKPRLEFLSSVTVYESESAWVEYCEE